MIFACTGAAIACFLYEGNRRNGALKNAVAGGISRPRIFTGSCIVSITVCTFIMLFVLTVWIASAELLLEKKDPVRLYDLLAKIPAVYLICSACIISALLFLECFEKNITGILMWCAVWLLIPRILLYAGMHYKFVYNIAMWLPQNFFLMINGYFVNTGECITAWDTAGGMARCISSGAIGILIFTLSGITILRRRDL